MTRDLALLAGIDAAARYVTARRDHYFRDTIRDAATNMLDCVEIRHYQRDEREGVVIATYETRQPGERDWQPVRLVKLVYPSPSVSCRRGPHSASRGHSRSTRP